MRSPRRNRVLLMAAAAGVVAGMITWLGSPPEEASGAAGPPVPGQRTESGIVRHVVDRPGVGTAFVADREGPDELSVTLHGETKTAPTEGEVTNPALSDAGTVAWAEDQARIKVWDPLTDELTTLGRPGSTTSVFSPAFVTNDRIVSIGGQAVPGVPGEDDGLNNLFEVSLDAGTWEPLTSFAGAATDWTALRTPVTTPDGDVLFVRVRGDSQATSEPRFELWSASAEGARRVTGLPGEMYLAGFDGDALLWNAPSEACDDWGLFQETSEGLDQVGCGAVLADPRDAVDPDLAREEQADFGAPPAHEDSDLAVIVGDFPSEDEAAAVELLLGAAPGQRVATHESLPHAVAPGAWVVLRPVAPGTSPDDALDEVRRAVPDYADMVYVVPSGD